MAYQNDTVIDDPQVRAALWQAWLDSQPGEMGGHEEGGFIVQDLNGETRIVRWPGGGQSSISMPSYANCKVGGDDIVATFHTHPNTGSDYLQEPGDTDRRAVRDDHDLKGPHYEGEFVLSQKIIYLITPGGEVRKIGSTSDIFGG